MSMVQIVQSANETEASIIKGFLNANGIETSYGPVTGYNGHTARSTVYCEESKSEEALTLLQKQGLIAS